MSQIRLVVLDLDGTVYRGSEAIPGAADTISGWLDAGIVVRYLTNNSGATTWQISEKLNRFGIPCRPEWVRGTAEAARRQCVLRAYRSVLVVGEPGLHETLADFRQGGDVEAVVVGICRSFTYELMSQAMQAIRQGADFIATNRDATYPREGGRWEPGAGSIVAAIETCSGVAPLVLGKPGPMMIHQILEETGIPASETLVVGDRLDTDIAAGEAACCRTWLVLTGVEPEIPDGQAGGDGLAEIELG